MNLRPVPPASFETPESLTDFITSFEDTEGSQALKSVAFPLMAGLLPRVAHDLGAPEEITEHLQHKGQVYVLPDHRERMDIPVHTGAVRRSRSLYPILEALDIESQPENFAVHPWVSILLRELGADGVGRIEDLRNPRFGTPPDRIREFMGVAMPLQMAISAQHINSGRHHATYWTGGRRGHKGRALERLTAKDVKDGVLERLEAIEDPDRVRLVLAGMDYSSAVVLRVLGVKLPFGVNVAFSRPYPIPKDRDALRELIAVKTQECNDAAAWMTRNVTPGLGVRALRSVAEADPAARVREMAARAGHLLTGARAA